MPGTDGYFPVLSTAVHVVGMQHVGQVGSEFGAAMVTGGHPLVVEHVPGELG